MENYNIVKRVQDILYYLADQFVTLGLSLTHGSHGFITFWVDLSFHKSLKSDNSFNLFNRTNLI